MGGLSVHQSRKLEAAGRIILSGIIMAVFYAFLSDGFTSFFPYINGIICALLLGALVSFLELELFSGKARRWKFIYLLILRTLLYSLFIPLIIFCILLITRTIKFNMGITEVLYSEEFQNYIFNKDFKIAIAYTLLLAFIISFTYQMSRKLGQGVLWDLISGKFHHPVEVERVFMFMNIRRSGKIIKKIGLLKFHKLLNDLAYDLSPSILAYKGKIYQYVEDELVISWNLDQGIKNSNCLRALFDAKEKIHARREKYFQLYGFIPQFRAAFHCGSVILGEVGDIKSETCYYGDVLNTTSRILGQCETLGKYVLVSSTLMKRLNLPVVFNSESCGIIPLKGKKEAIELFCIEEVQLPELS
ncbi:hypothetical protein BH23BAC1_BH23BAC1_16370 [soil metagenome]